MYICVCVYMYIYIYIYIPLRAEHLEPVKALEAYT